MIFLIHRLVSSETRCSFLFFLSFYPTRSLSLFSFLLEERINTHIIIIINWICPAHYYT